MFAGLFSYKAAQILISEVHREEFNRSSKAIRCTLLDSELVVAAAV